MGWSEEEYRLVFIEQSNLDFKEVGYFRDFVEEILAKGHKNIIIDLSQLQEITSLGIGALIEIMKQIGQVDGRFKLVGVNKDVYNAFQTSNLQRIINMHLSAPSE